MKNPKSKRFVSANIITQEVFKNTYCCWHDGEIQVLILEDLLTEHEKVVGELHG